MEDKYTTRARQILMPSSSNQVSETIRNLLLQEAKDKNITLLIKSLITLLYPCKCVYSAEGFVNEKNFEIIGKEDQLINAYINIKNEIFVKNMR